MFDSIRFLSHSRRWKASCYVSLSPDISSYVMSPLRPMDIDLSEVQMFWVCFLQFEAKNFRTGVLHTMKVCVALAKNVERLILDWFVQFFLVRLSDGKNDSGLLIALTRKHCKVTVKAKWSSKGLSFFVLLLLNLGSSFLLIMNSLFLFMIVYSCFPFLFTAEPKCSQKKFGVCFFSSCEECIESQSANLNLTSPVKMEKWQLWSRSASSTICINALRSTSVHRYRLKWGGW